ncbi:MAG: hypothetical protein ACRDDZ_09850 [Marinifilaceae bacterium]
MEFFYPNLQNDMWRIIGYVFFENKDYFLADNKKAFDKDKLIDFLSEKGIAIFDTAEEIIRLKDNASDKFLEVVVHTDIANLLRQIPNCRAIVTTGQKATDLICSQLNINEQPAVGQAVLFMLENREYAFYRMPSTSRAYPKPIIEKAMAYAAMFKQINLL